jgi:hypothetical protein
MLINEYSQRNKDSFKHAKEISKPYGEIERVLDWCKTELIEDWRWQLVEMSTPARRGRYVFYFDGERDCVAFSLKWA